MLRKTIFVLLCLGAVIAQSVYAAPISQQDIKNLAQKSNLPMEAFAVAMVPMDSNESAFWYRPDAPMNPASAMKLVTTYGAIELLGPHHTWTTYAYASGNITKKGLKGNLHIKLTGDPQLTEEKLWRLLTDVRNAGVSHITGDIVIDGYSLRMPQHLQSFKDSGNKTFAPYMVDPSPLLVNYNLQSLHARVIDGEVVANLSPQLPSVNLVNQLKVRGNNCPPADSLMTVSGVNSNTKKATVTLKGNIGKNCELNRYLSALNPDVFSKEFIAQLWKEIGGTFNGNVRLGSVPSNKQLLGSITSSDVAGMMRDINKWSNNVMAKQLYLNIGAKHRKPTDSDDSAAARRTITEWIRKKGINTQGLQFDNGSGLSRSERLTVRQTAKLLESAWKSSFGAEFIASLPLVALDGTLRNRMKGSTLEGEGHLKTGALADSRALAGFIRDGDGKGWVLVFYVNHPNAANVLPVLDEVLVNWHRLRSKNVAQSN